MTYIKNGTRYTEDEIKTLNPTIAFCSTTVEELGYKVVFATPQPTVNDLQVVIPNGVETDSKGNFVEAWSVVPKFQTIAEEEAYTLELTTKAKENAIKHFTDKTTDFIQSKIDAYNLANGVAFQDIDAFAKYALVPTSSYNAISVRFIAYADKVWSAVRNYQATATAIPTDESFQAVLDGVVF